MIIFVTSHCGVLSFVLETVLQAITNGVWRRYDRHILCVLPPSRHKWTHLWKPTILFEGWWPATPSKNRRQLRFNPNVTRSQRLHAAESVRKNERWNWWHYVTCFCSGGNFIRKFMTLTHLLQFTLQKFPTFSRQKKGHTNLKVGQRIELEPKLWSRDSFSHKYEIYFDKSCQMLITWLQAVRSKANKWITFQLKTVKPLFSKTQLAQLHPRDFSWIQWT